MLIDTDILYKLPNGFRLLRVETIKDMEGKTRKALRIIWTEYHNGRACGNRIAHFCGETGEYLGEAG